MISLSFFFETEEKSRSFLSIFFLFSRAQLLLLSSSSVTMDEGEVRESVLYDEEESSEEGRKEEQRHHQRRRFPSSSSSHQRRFSFSSLLALFSLLHFFDGSSSTRSVPHLFRSAIGGTGGSLAERRTKETPSSASAPSLAHPIKKAPSFFLPPHTLSQNRSSARSTRWSVSSGRRPRRRPRRSP